MTNELKRIAMISGVTGQDGGDLAKLLLKKIIGFWACIAVVLPILIQI
jgi:GDP-D-mannose dehydratase